MESNKLISIAIIVLALSILSGSAWIGYAIQKVNDTEVDTSELLLINKGLITEEEAAEYLSISLNKFQMILIKESKEKDDLSGYNLYRFIPYIELDNGTKMFTVKGLDEWVVHNMFNKY